MYVNFIEYKCQVATPEEKKQIPAPIKPSRGKNVDYSTTKPLYFPPGGDTIIQVATPAEKKQMPAPIKPNRGKNVDYKYNFIPPPQGATLNISLFPSRWLPQLRRNKCQPPLNPIEGRMWIMAQLNRELNTSL